jgi:proteasome assembly chaperone (PAC2) family protein
MELKVIKEVKVNDLTIVASLPDMGRVGGLVSSFLSKFLNAELVAELTSVEKPWVAYSDGVVRSVTDVYKIFFDAKHSLLILTGESQPQDPGELYGLCSRFLDYAQSVGTIRVLYGAGGYLREQLTGAPRVCGVVNKPALTKVLERAGIEPVGNEITTITWFNGIILGQAAERGIDGIGLFGEISETTTPQPLAAKSILAALARLEKLEVDTKPLDQQYESILEEVQKKKDPSSFGPGIG